MAKFAYEARGANGKEVRGEVEAGNEAEARVKIRAQRLIPIRVSSPETKISAARYLGAGNVKSKDLQLFTRQLATLISSGVPVIQAMDVLARSARSPALNNALKDVIASISRGKRFADALSEHPRVFDRFYCNMVRAGEESGNLDQILNRLASYIEKAVKIQGKVKGAMVYPIAIMFVAAGVVAALLIFVIPKFESLFKQSGKELPALTQIVVEMSHFVVDYWWALIGGVIFLVLGAINYYRSADGRKTCDRVFIDVPLMGDLVQKSAVAKFSRTLSTLLGSGVGIMESLDIASKVVGNFVIENAILRAKDAITEGKSLTVPLTKEKYIPSMVTQMIGVGETTGNLDQMLGKIADFYEDEVDVAVGALTSVMEPIMMVFLGGIIAFLVIAMYLPIFDLAGNVGGN